MKTAATQTPTPLLTHTKLTAPTISCSTYMVKKIKSAQQHSWTLLQRTGVWVVSPNTPTFPSCCSHFDRQWVSLNASLGSQGPSAKSGQRRMWRGGGAKNGVKNKHEEEGHWKGMGALLDFNFIYLFWIFRKIEKKYSIKTQSEFRFFFLKILERNFQKIPLFSFTDALILNIRTNPKSNRLKIQLDLMALTVDRPASINM